MLPTESLRDLAGLWQRTRDGLPTALLGRLPECPSDLQLVHVHCDAAVAGHAPLVEAQWLIQALLGEPEAPAPVKKPAKRSRKKAVPERGADEILAELWDRLAHQPGPTRAIAFLGVEAAEAATVATLTQIVGQADGHKLPLILVFGAEPEGPAAELLAAVRRHMGDDAVLRREAPSVAAPPGGWRTLPIEVVQVLRACATIGCEFSGEDVAALVRIEPLRVLERLQAAADLGIALVDHGEQRFSLPTELVAELTASLLPSLARGWRQRLGQRAPAPVVPVTSAAPAELSERTDEAAAVGDPPAAVPPEPAAVEAPEAPAATDAAPDQATEIAASGAEPAAAEAPAGEVAATVEEESEPANVAPAGDLSGRTDSPSEPTAVTDGETSEVRSEEELDVGDLEEVDEASWSSGSMFVRGSGGRPRGAPLPPHLRPKAPRIASLSAQATSRYEARMPTRNPALDVAARIKQAPVMLATPEVGEARQAEELRRAGDLDAAAQFFYQAAREAAEMGAPKAAAGHVQQVLAVLKELSPTPERRHLRGLALLELGQLQWQSAGPDLGFSLTQALASLEAAAVELGLSAATELAVQLCQAIAGVCFEIGDQKSLSRALQELAAASRMLHADGDPTAGARLLNDQAAVLVQMGDPVQALHLLRESRKVFQARAAEDPVALRELAETDHLFARLPLHAEMRAGREVEGYRAGLGHAQKAERAFRQLEDARELGRVWETMGRLELRMEQLETATKHLESAVDVQMQLGDLTGLARSTEALSEALGLRGRDAEAIDLLRDSIQYNRNKGSPLGLSVNRRVFSALAERLGSHPLHAPALQEVAVLLDAGERELGTIDSSIVE
jgi:tetratricopeptide (TPR) repeat protein